MMKKKILKNYYSKSDCLESLKFLDLHGLYFPMLLFPSIIQPFILREI